MFVHSIFALSYIICSVQSFLVLPSINRRIRTELDTNQDIYVDAGDPLFLTPYIRKGQIKEGQKKARVSLTDKLNITSYSGYITVNEQFDSNMFFWYFPAIEPGQQEAPVLVWLQGGPGGSSLYGLFEENGPIKFEGGKLVKRDINWASNHHMIYIDNPVGTGFSFTNDSKGYCTEQVQVGEELHNMLTQFFKLFPERQNNDFFISGESYAGKYIPALGYTIHKKNPTAEIQINLKGLAIGDGSVDPINALEFDKYLYQLGFIDWNAAAKLRKIQNEVKYLIEKKQFNNASIHLNNMKDYEPNLKNMYNYIKLQPYDLNRIEKFLNEPNIQKAIHVGCRKFVLVNYTVHDILMPDLLKSVAPWLSELLEHYQVLTYNGQLDLVVPYPLTINYLRQLNFSGAEEYKTAPRYEWKVDDQIAGFVKQARRLTEVMVRNAGHMVPLDQPKWALDLITRFTYNIPFH